ncbi:bifunctional 3-(3-hydroxy-phenyl)propionate/3-hydroxycinnamic acid hydroxylase [Rhizobium sp. P38BS-XIX]|uniref:bifunctional 3-(3-hydroxy-phenyl)propionate/3-hydroxycinnamic acid hydroxylase n=1 Tax=Rhizobium sp. P38BS-XIX TaxID=2726740 RepID=UPI001456BA7D|nr:bifunctional 3-(3-hydroxy-phenyl)propionate/3-hydroxycinnamic acid hydroxylase [Rhizobium sp. P38BS-XIX]NLR97399.1 bifunctional 3-(3-hydroxy-phenyl)propionate/3-hydroxycinnamic acid hydroxylase [Rhizobium sp. P38BS-XIX]
MNDYQVIIIGFGPSGAMAANLLGKAGITTLCVDRTTEVYDKPRAIALDHEIMRLFDNIGLRESIEAHVAPFDLSEHFGASGQLLRRVGMVGEPYPLGYTPTMVFTQPPVEKALRAHAAQWPSVSVLLGADVTAVSNVADKAVVSLRESDGTERNVSAQYIIACDGASSGTRERLGLTLEDLNFDEPWVVVDVLVNPDKLDRVPVNSSHFCNPERPVAYIVGPENHRRWEIMLREDENPRDVEKQEWVWKFLDRWITPDDATIWRSAAYRFHALVAPQWREGRFFLAGDAAHQQPPILGQGMCQGMRDVANLCWKLQAVLRDNAPSELLDTYGDERRDHVRELIMKIKEIGAVLCERDPEAAIRRDERILAESDGLPRTLFRQSIIPPIRHGLIDSTGGAGTGELFPQPSVTSRGGKGLLDTVCGGGWRLIIDAQPFGELSPYISDKAHQIGMTILYLRPENLPANDDVMAFVEESGILRRWFDERKTSAAIVRPDHYVYSVATSEESIERHVEDLSARLRRVNPCPDTMERVA